MLSYIYVDTIKENPHNLTMLFPYRTKDYRILFHRAIYFIRTHKHVNGLIINDIIDVLSLEHLIIWLRDLDTKKIEAEIFGELRNVVLEENGEDKIVRESN